MAEFSDIPIVPLPGSDKWAGAYEWGNKIDDRFPDQDASDFSYACLYNDPGPTTDHGITAFVMEQQGENDEGDWIWRVTFDDGTTWRATGGCDYTGWDCQSDLSWEKI